MSFPLVRLLIGIGPAILLLGEQVWPAETVLERFPVVVRAGMAGGRPQGDSMGRVLPDRPFLLERGYGHVGGYPGRLGRVPVRGGDAAWPLAWREGVEKYAFRVPHGDYLVELAFLETHVAYPGLRVFDVVAENRPLFPGLDIVELAGDFAWVSLTGVVPVRDGWLDLRFVPVTAGHPPRVSRIRILPAPETGGAPTRPTVQAHGGPGATTLAWQMDNIQGITGYGVFRAESPAGPFDSLTEKPVLTQWFQDAAAAPGRTWHYKVCAYDVHGNQSAFSDPVSARSTDVSRLGLKVYDLRISGDDLLILSERRDPPGVATGEFRHLGALYYVDVSYDTSRDGWRGKKSFRLSVQRDRSRRFGRRENLYLSAEANDPTRLREKLSAEAAGLLGLATPIVEPVALVLNGRFQGLYFDIELLDKRFRRRTQLDRVGLLSKRTRDDLLVADWEPYGHRVGEEGNLISLTELVHGLNRIGEGEMPAFLDRTLYLDRFFDRAALAAVRGERDRGSALGFLLRDSRNGKWELFQDRHRSGDWGIVDGGATRGVLTDRDARRMIYGDSLIHGGVGIGGTAVLETRLFNQPELRDTYLRRLDELLAKEFSPDGFQKLVDGTSGLLRAAALEDAHLWPAVGDETSVLSAPERIQDAFRARAELLRSPGVREAAGGKPSLVLSEILILPSAGRPWVEVRNAADTRVDAGQYRLGSSFRGPRPGVTPPGPSLLLPRRDLRPGEHLRVEIPEGLDSASGGILTLAQLAGPTVTTPRLVDVLFYGHQTRDVPYGRLPGGQGGWGFLATATPGEANASDELLPPPHECRQGLTLEQSGAFTVWFRPGMVPEDSPGRPVQVILKHRVGRASEFESVEMSWDDDNLRYTTTLGPDKQPVRRAHYFLVVSRSGVERVHPLPAPELTYFMPVLPDVKINEVLPRPFRDGSGPGEFVELFNASDRPVDIGGYFLTDSTRNPTKWRVPPGSLIPPRGFILFYADGLNKGNHTSFKLSNSGEFLGLYGRMEEGNLRVHTVAYRGMRTGESWGAMPDGSKNFRAWKDPTPGSRNRPKIPKEYLEKMKAEREKAAKEGD